MSKPILTVDAEELCVALRSVSYAAASYPHTSFAFDGILLEYMLSCALVATDGARLARIFLKTVCAENAGKLILPIQTLRDVSQRARASKKGARVEMYAEGESIRIVVSDVVVKCNPIRNKRYPDYMKIIPLQPTSAWSFQRTDLTEALRKLVRVADRKHHRIRFRLSRDRASLQAGKTTIRVAVEKSPRSEDVDIFLDGKMLSVYLHHLPSTTDRITLHTHGPAKCTMWTSIPEHLYLQMPIVESPAVRL
jgi:DNA polymerase III sliding clamp (beta) subunit (PCNA family)